MEVKTKTKMRKQKKKTEKKLVKTNGEKLRRGIDSNTLPKKSRASGASGSLPQRRIQGRPLPPLFLDQTEA